MWLISSLGSLALIIVILVDSFEATVLPRRVTHRFRFSRFFYRNGWTLWRTLALRMPEGKWRESFLSLFGPQSLLGLLASWVLSLIVGFGWLHWSLATPLQTSAGPPTFFAYVYWSGNTFFTLGYGDFTPTAPLGRALSVTEAGLGFAFLGVIIGYLPVIYHAYSGRERTISLLDARAGSPPSAAQLLLRVSRAASAKALGPFLAEWEQWSAELLESHLSFPVLAYYRSQHDNQSWLAALAAILDTCALLIIEIEAEDSYQARLTFAMARHAAVDLALILKTPPREGPNRLPADRLEWLRQELVKAGMNRRHNETVDSRLAQLRATYEPFLEALAEYLLFSLPSFVPDRSRPDNWQTSAWLPRAPALGDLPAMSGDDSHFG